MPAPTLPEVDPVTARPRLPAEDFAWWLGWAGSPPSPPAEILVVSAPLPSGAPEVPEAGAEAEFAPAATPELPAACNAASTGQDGPGSQPPAVPSPGEAPPAARAEGAIAAAPGGADTPAPGADGGELPAASNAASAGQDGPGSVPRPRPAEPWGAPLRFAGDAEEAAETDPADEAGEALPAALTALLAALDAEERAADAWLDDFLADRVGAESAFELGLSGGVFDWPFR